MVEMERPYASIIVCASFQKSKTHIIRNLILYIFVFPFFLLHHHDYFLPLSGA